MTWAEWLRDKADTFVLLALFCFLLWRGSTFAREAFGALLLALTGGSRGPKNPSV